MRICTTIILFVLLGDFLFSQVDTVKKKQDISDLSLEELLNLKVFSASKKIESVKEAPAIISLINLSSIINNLIVNKLV